ncbi:hypothetical protein [Tautonia plasticadhaerens]|uniref:Uncharacterized protein n=1 Tax=Tautonia plasticadhaerens TaxID=2527974 RepID=A0A518H7K7_9BACT|nr:hypothetical protein [Tautonia plasticadhaerens]QDV36840.1 hypothetical protein ElP_47690 [Tautonia plasticadhaerens]
MIHTQNQIIVSEGPCEAHGTAHICVHHREFPENWTEGESPRVAAGHLLNLFLKNLDSVGGARHRERVEHAIADIREYLDGLDDPTPGAPHPG